MVFGLYCDVYDFIYVHICTSSLLFSHDVTCELLGQCTIPLAGTVGRELALNITVDLSVGGVGPDFLDLHCI